MPVIHFILADGSEHAIDGETGTSVMRLAKRNEISGILAECGGACCCATCHVHIDRQWIARLPDMAEDEQDILEFAEEVDDTSRLSCQIKITATLDGLIVHVPESFNYKEQFAVGSYQLSVQGMAKETGKKRQPVVPPLSLGAGSA